MNILCASAYVVPNRSNDDISMTEELKSAFLEDAKRVNAEDSLNARKKRGAAEYANPMTDVVERVNEIYNSVITSEQCMERIACELGGLASDVGLKESPMAKMADLFVTAKYKPYYKQFKSGQNCEKIKCGSLPF